MSTNPISTNNDKSKDDKIKSVKGKSGKGRVVVSWTGGKDGCLACYGAISEGFEVSHLLNFREIQRRGSHDINPDLIYAQAEALGIPLIHKDFISYEQEFKKVINDLRDSGEQIDGAVEPCRQDMWGTGPRVNNAALAEEFRTDHKRPHRFGF